MTENTDGRSSSGHAVLRLTMVTITTVAAVLALWLWLGLDDPREIERREASDERSLLLRLLEPKVDPMAGRLTPGEGRPDTDLKSSWPGFRGPQWDGVARENVKLARQWPKSGPPIRWNISVGEGFAGAAIADGCAYILDYDREAQADTLRCLSMTDGREIWRYAYSLPVKRNHGMSRTTVAVAAGRVVSLGPKCHVLCADAATGEPQWAIDLVKEYGTTVPQWYAGQCPLIDGERVILAPAGRDVLMMAIELATGKVLWQTPNNLDWQMTHTSITPAVIGGRRQYLYAGSGGVASVAADSGDLLWSTGGWRISIAAVPSPVYAGAGLVLLTGGYDAGAKMVHVDTTTPSPALTDRWQLGPDIFGAPQATPVFHDGFIYGIPQSGELVCVDPAGKVQWRSGEAQRWGLGPMLVADGLVIALRDKGELTLVEATPGAFTLLAEHKVLDGHDAWGPLALAGGLLLCRDLTTLACVDLR